MGEANWLRPLWRRLLVVGSVCRVQWAVPLHMFRSLVHEAGLDEKMKAQNLVLRFPDGKEKRFETISRLALWATTQALDAD